MGRKMIRRVVVMVALSGVSVMGMAQAAKAEIEAYTCWNSYPFRGAIVSVPETCYREVYRPAYTPPARPRFMANVRIDGDANIRTGASITSRVVVKTTRVQSVQVHSYSADGDWAYLTTANGAVGWTNKVNILPASDD